LSGSGREERSLTCAKNTLNVKTVSALRVGAKTDMLRDLLPYFPLFIQGLSFCFAGIE
jgi:hypothetical protein